MSALQLIMTLTKFIELRSYEQYLIKTRHNNHGFSIKKNNKPNNDIQNKLAYQYLCLKNKKCNKLFQKLSLWIFRFTLLTNKKNICASFGNRKNTFFS